MPVPSTINDMSTTPSANSPATTESVIYADDYFRSIQAIIRSVYDAQQTSNGNYALKIGATFTGAINEAQGADIASAATVNLTTATGNYVHVTGVTTITAITLAQGYERVVVFDGILILTNGASLLLPTSANITTAAGDVAVFRGEAAGVVRCVYYQKKNGTALSAVIPSGSITASGYTQNTSKLLGRTTASSGAIEEISIGTGLSLSAGSLSVTGASGVLIGYQIFTASGSYTKATNNPSFVVVEVVGGGGGGGGAGTTSGANGGAGGGGGYSRKKILASSLSASETVTVGTGGSAGASGSNAGGAGNTSSFGAFCSATGGSGGAGGTGSAARQAAGGSGSGGDLNITGGMGFSPNAGQVSIGGGSQFTPPAGKAFGAQGAGSAGQSYGGGAAGGYSTGTAQAGAAGADGIVIVWEYA